MNVTLLRLLNKTEVKNHRSDVLTLNFSNAFISKKRMFQKYIQILNGLGLKTSLKVLLCKLFSVNHYYVLTRNLKSLEFERTIRFQYQLEKMTEDGWADVADDLKSSDRDCRREFYSRLLFYKSGFKNCYVLKNKNKEIACMLWVVYPSENEIIKKHFKKKFYPLRDNQVMLENVFTIPKYRGFGFSPTATIEILNLVRSQGYKSAIIYSRKDRIDSLNDIMKLGFKIQKLIKEYKVFGFVWRTL